jgi:hypothetical protein
MPLRGVGPTGRRLDLERKSSLISRLIHTDLISLRQQKEDIALMETGRVPKNYPVNRLILFPCIFHELGASICNVLI